MSYKIVELKVKDLRNVQLIDIDLKGKQIVEARGVNGAGKSTVIDSIFTAISGTKYMTGKYGRSYPLWEVIKQGEDRAIIKVVLADGSKEVEIKRSLTKKEGGGLNTSLVIKSTDGQKLDQRFLDSLINEFTVDPLEFARKPVKEQVEIIKDIAGISTDKLEEQQKEYAEERLYVKRQLADIEGVAKKHVEPVEFVDVQELAGKLMAIRDKNREVLNARERIKDFAADQKRIEEKIKDLQRQLEQIKEAKEKVEEKFAGKEIEDTEAIELQLQTAKETNKKAAEYEQVKKAVETADGLKSQIKEFTDKIEAIRREKQEKIANSELPFKRLDIQKDVGIVIDGVPFTQMSTAEQIKISARIGVDMKNGLKLLCIKDGSLLDTESMATIKELAKKYDYQIIIERVGEEAGEDTIILREGRLISAFAGKAEKKGDIL